MYKALQTQIAMITEDKVTKIFCITDDFCNFFDAIMAKYMLKTINKRKYHCYSTMSKAEIMLMIFYHRGERTARFRGIRNVINHAPAPAAPPMKRDFISR